MESLRHLARDILYTIIWKATSQDQRLDVFKSLYNDIENAIDFEIVAAISDQIHNSVSEVSCVESIIKRAPHLLGDTWIEFPVELRSSGLKCDPTLTPARILYLRLPEKELLLSKLREAWGYQGFYL